MENVDEVLLQEAVKVHKERYGKKASLDIEQLEAIIRELKESK